MTTPTDSYVNRIQALLNKAESTAFPEEAEALLAKAQELMARHAIDEAMLAAGGASAEAVIDERIVIGAPYATAKASLLAAVVNANRCRMAYGSGPSGTKYATVVGHRADIANVTALYNALSLQAVRFMLEAKVPRGDTPRRFRHAFLLAYASRISERLQAAERAATAEATEEQLRSPAGPSVTLVLANRDAKVEQAFKQAFPHLRRARTTVSSAAGVVGGRAAADRASLGGRQVGGGRRRIGPG